MMPPKNKFADGERVLCFHGPLLYEAKTIKAQIKDKIVRYFVHYQGWNKSWDEWVPENRVLKYNDENVEKQKSLRDAHEASKSKKKSKGRGDDGSGLGSPAPSTSSTGGKTSSRSAAGDSRGSTSGGGPDKKRVKLEPNVESELEYTKKVEVKIKIPDDLKQWLVDDWDFVTRQKKLLNVPVTKNSVDTILDSYVNSRKGKKSENQVIEVMRGISEYFNVMLGCQLLYKFERPQYQKVSRETNDTMSSIYGATHLLRLFVKLGQMLAYTDMDEKDMKILLTHIQDFLSWMSRSNLVSINDYITASPEYLRKIV